MSRLLSGCLVVALAIPAVPAGAAEAVSPPAAPGIRASALQAALALGARQTQASETPVVASSPVPRTLPRQGRSSKQMSGGGGAGMMVMGLVSTAAGIAGTYFIYKAMKDQNDKATAADR